MLVVHFIGNDEAMWPHFCSANHDGPLDNAKMAAQASMRDNHFPWATRFEIVDQVDPTTVLYSWPEKL